jgi:acyl-CoA thioesterase-2
VSETSETVPASSVPAPQQEIDIPRAWQGRAANAPDGVGVIEGVRTAQSPGEALAKVLGVIDVTPDPAAGEDMFAGTSYTPPWGRIFGGQVLAQALNAAIKTIDTDRHVHSLHAYFLRPGNPDVPLQFAVERLRDGRSFSARRTHALQNGKPILSMIASFQAPAHGLDHQVEMPDVPAPEELPTLEQQLGSIDIPSVQEILRSRPVDLRHVDGPIYLAPAPRADGRHMVWFRPAAPLPDDQLVHTSFLAYCSDFSLLESVLRRHGLAWSTRGIRTASLDHAMWFHRPVRLDDWLLYVQESPSASGARGLALGHLFSRDGVLLASVAQEGMMRVPEDSLPHA